MSIDEDYCKPIITRSAFNNNHIQYESRGSKDKLLTVNEYFETIRPYLSGIVNDHKTQSEWKIQLAMIINFISSISDSDETCTMRTKSNNVEIIMSSETDNVGLFIEGLFRSLSERYQEGLEESTEGRKFIFDSVDSFYYDLNKISLNRGGSYIDSAEWLKNKKAIINPKNNDDKCFQYTLTVVLNYKQIRNNPQRIPNIRPLIDQYNWKCIDSPTSSDLWKVFERNNKSIALNILYVPHNTKEIRHTYKLKHNLKHENQAVLLMITDGEKWHYLAVIVFIA